MKIKQYTLEITSEEQTIDMPDIFQILTVQLQYNKIVLFAVVDDDSTSTPHAFVLYTTDDEVVDVVHHNYIGTVQTHLVKNTYHLYQVNNLT